LVKRGAFATLITIILGIFFCCTSPERAVKIAVPIILAQRKGHEKIGNRNDFAALRQLVQKWLFKGKVRRKLRWVKSGGFNQQLIDCHLAADVLFSNLKGHHPFNSIKPVSAGTGIVN
jgi:hypothetical protein